jgi:hypothetical protein
MVKLNKIGKYSSILINDSPTTTRTTTTKQNLDPRCMYVPTRVKSRVHTSLHKFEMDLGRLAAASEVAGGHTIPF